jgi:hypothetical protein
LENLADRPIPPKEATHLDGFAINGLSKVHYRVWRNEACTGKLMTLSKLLGNLDDTA